MLAQMPVGGAPGLRIIRSHCRIGDACVIRTQTNRPATDALGYIRLHLAEFLTLGFSERMVFEDQELCEELTDRGISVVRAGFCDWMDVSRGVDVCVGWAWFECFGDCGLNLAPGGFSTNVRLLDGNGSALSADHAERMLGLWLSQCNWQGSVTSPVDGYTPAEKSMH